MKSVNFDIDTFAWFTQKKQSRAIFPATFYVGTWQWNGSRKTVIPKSWRLFCFILATSIVNFGKIGFEGMGFKSPPQNGGWGDNINSLIHFVINLTALCVLMKALNDQKSHSSFWSMISVCNIWQLWLTDENYLKAQME